MQELNWQQPEPSERKYILVASGETTGTLEFSEAKKARATVGENSYAFEGAFLKILLKRNEQDFAHFDPTNAISGLLVQPGKTVHHWRNKEYGFAEAVWVWQSSTGAELVRFSSNGVIVETAAADLEEVALLVTFGWFLIVVGRK